MIGTVRPWFLVTSLFLAGAAPAVAQSTTGTITGRAGDSSGAILPGVAVSITSPQMIGGARDAVTDSLGTYRFTLVPPGVYQVKFQLASFRGLTVKGVVGTANGTLTLNAPLQVESLSESVTVVSTTPTIDLQSTQVGVNW